MTTVTNDNFARVKMLDDGSIQNRRIEAVALFMADGLTEQAAWTHANGNNSKDGSRSYRRKIVGNPVFKLRIEDLMAEKTELEDDPVFGQAIWMANQVYRHAVVAGDVPGMERAAKMRLDAAKAKQTASAKPMPGTPPARPGAPVAENPQASQSAMQIRERLIGRGMSIPVTADDEA